MAPFTLFHRRSTAPLSPLEAHSFLLARDPAAPNPKYQPGGGTFDPQNINNKGIFALFALIGATFVLAAIWFFFWAKNGGFHWRKGDWDDYKSTVLRRKGPNGTTLSGATKTTELGGGSIVADADKDYEDEAVYWEKANQNGGKGVKASAGGRGRKNKQPRGSKNNNDDDVRAYRHEKPAKVGGLNREADGAYHHDFAYSTDPSEMSERNYRHVSSSTTKPPSKPKPTPQTPQNKKSKASGDKGFYTHSPSSTSSHRPLRPNGASNSGTSTPTRSSRQSSPRKYNGNRWEGSMPGTYNQAYTEPLDFESRYSATASEAGQTEDSRGTKAYFHPIPGLGGAGSRSHGGYAAASGGGGGGGFRRGGVGGMGRGRRDSLSDSDGETEMS